MLIFSQSCVYLTLENIMVNNLSSVFLNRQYMISKDFEIYYYKVPPIG